MKNVTAAEQTFDNIQIVSWMDGTIRHTHILHLTPAYRKNIEKSPLESGLSGKKLVEAMRHEDRNALYHDLTKAEARALKQRGAEIDIPEDEFTVVPSIRSVSVTTGVETSRSHWKKTDDATTCVPHDPAKYDPARPERVTAAVQYHNEQTGALERRCYFPAGKSSDPAQGVAADAEIENGFEYTRHHYNDGLAEDGLSTSGKYEAAKTIFDRVTRKPAFRMFMVKGAAHDPVACRVIKKDDTLERPSLAEIGACIPAVQKFDAKTGKLTAATSFNLFVHESKLDQAEIDALNKAWEPKAPGAYL